MSSSFAKLTSSPGLGTNNFSFYAIPVAWVLAIAPHSYAMALFNKERAPGTSEWDNQLPGKNRNRVTEAKLSPAMGDRFLRSEAAADNQFTGLPLFAAAIIAGNMARVPPRTLNTFAGLYLTFRAAYIYLYINGTTRFFAGLRSATWLGSMVTCLTLFVQAGNKFKSGLGNVAL